MTYVIIHALAPIFVIMLLGFWAGKAGMVDNKNVSLLNIFVMDFALPATLFSATVQTPWAGIVAQSPLVLVLTGAMWITYAAIYFLATSVFKRTPQDAAVLTLTVALPNYAALGLPILGSVLGEGASTSLSVAVSIACGSVLMTPFCATVESSKSFVDAYVAAYGTTPNQFAADAYDGVYIVKAALEQAGCTADMSNEEICDALVSAITSLKFTGLTGTDMSWNAEGQVSKAPTAYVVKDGQYVEG